MQKVHVQARVHPNVKEELEKQAGEKDMKPTQYIGDLLTKHVEKQTVKHTSKNEVK